MQKVFKTKNVYLSHHHHHHWQNQSNRSKQKLTVVVIRINILLSPLRSTKTKTKFFFFGDGCACMQIICFYFMHLCGFVFVSFEKTNRYDILFLTHFSNNSKRENMQNSVCNG